MLPAKAAPVLFALILSFIISGVATYRAAGMIEGFGALWIAAWLPSWAVAFPCIFVFAPMVRKLVARITA